MALPSLTTKARIKALIIGVIAGSALAIFTSGATVLEELKIYACRINTLVEITNVFLAGVFIAGVTSTRMRNSLYFGERGEIIVGSLIASGIIVSYVIAEILTARHLQFVECDSIFVPRL